ncbi:MAG: hypothetical protein H0T73_06715 [Ardenticatenales bacterium]|nr:hypothetical protein [Ardenticatenales bacterium]
MPNNEHFHESYRQLEERMKALAEVEGDVFLPNLTPEGPVEYVLICMEPSLGQWAHSPEDARSKVEAGFRNFLFSIEDFILHYCARHYLCEAGEHYHITDLSKGAMLVDHAAHARNQRYDRWYSLLQEELDLVAPSNAAIVAVGNAVAQHLERRKFQRPFTQVIHYSGQAAQARNMAVAGQEDNFQAFRDSVSLKEVVATAHGILSESGIPAHFREETLSRLAKSQLSLSRQKLIFHYKRAFEAIHS